MLVELKCLEANCSSAFAAQPAVIDAVNDPKTPKEEEPNVMLESVFLS